MTRIITYGDIMDGGNSVFTSVTGIDDLKLVVTFKGVIRTDNPDMHLNGYLTDLEKLIPGENATSIEIDFRDLTFCNSNGFYIIMDIVELLYGKIVGPVNVKRLKDDDWQQQTLPILLNTDEPDIEQRTTFEDFIDY